MSRELATALRTHAEACARLGSPMTAALLAASADDAERAGPVVEVARAHLDGEPSSEQLMKAGVPLRLVGSVHRLVLDGQLPELAAHYPTAVPGHGPADPTRPQRDPMAAWPVFRDALGSHPSEIAAGMAAPPQTNEVGRAAGLLGGLAALLADRHLPVRLVELGASAGLNMGFDRFRLQLEDGRGLGPRDSPVRLDAPWPSATGPPLPVTVEVADRCGCDLTPIDPTSSDGARSLHAYTWPDQPERHRRLAGAIELARQHPVEVQRRPASALVAATTPREGTLTLVWHSVFRQYLEDDERARVDAAMEALGAAATPDAPVAHLALEPTGSMDRRAGHLLTVRSWPGGARTLLADAHPHGTWIRWRSAVPAA